MKMFITLVFVFKREGRIISCKYGKEKYLDNVSWFEGEEDAKIFNFGKWGFEDLKDCRLLSSVALSDGQIMETYEYIYKGEI